MARRLIRDTCTLAAEIMDGEHDADLGFIAQAVQARKRNMFRPGTKVRFVAARPDLDGQIAEVVKVNARSITVGLGERDQFGFEQEYNVDMGLLELVGKE